MCKLTYTFVSLKFLVFTYFCHKKFCCLLICILYARIRHTGTLFNDIIVPRFLFSVYSLISLMFFGFCHVNSHRVIEIVIKTLRHFLQVQGHPCVHEEEFFTGQLISWSNLPTWGVIFFRDSCPQKIQDGSLYYIGRIWTTQCSQTAFLKLVRCNA